MRKSTVILLMCLMVLISLTGCGRKNKAECAQLISSFEESCNELNVNGILNCINPKISDPLKGVMAIGENLLGADAAEGVSKVLESIGAGIGSIFTEDGVQMSEMLANIQLEPTKYHLKKKEGCGICKATATVNGIDFIKNLKISVIKNNDEWYISGIALADDES